MIHTLYARLALTLTLALGLVGLIYGVFMFTTVQKNTQYAEQLLNRNLAKTLVNERNLVHENTLDKQALKDMFMAYMTVNPSIEIYLLDLQGKVLSYSADPGQVKRDHVSLQPIRAFLQKNASFPLLGDDPRSLDRQKVFSVTPIPMTDNPSGYLYVILRGEQYDAVEQLARDKELLYLGAWVVSIALFVSLVVGLLVFYPITRRLRKLSQQVDAFRQSEFRTLPDFQASEGKDELSQLERNVAEMAKQTVQQFEQISKQDVKRRDLFASLSHDLRTPLAALHGYLETLEMKADSLDEQQRHAYTERAIKFSDRLKHLIDELFEMAKLDTLDSAPQIEPFALPELVQDMLQQYEAGAQHRGVSLVMKGDTHMPLVQADIALIQRVFENLLGNALRYVKKGDVITVSLEKHDMYVKVELADTGCGIQEDILPHIFDPLYQGNNTHRGDEHSGLGLAIVKRILELHQSHIQVQSTLNHGTRFTFRLFYTGEHNHA
ncbi:sensor histidine kinase [Ghiorsea bivora]|uniref:sensor histidine kinase n=1 Tax=Ghiorsea bivora TaxID=1485545 RepID=UPI00056DD30F|nr:HAMP domain-containing sensor histidine kinase [Ghiorsea bivora]